MEKIFIITGKAGTGKNKVASLLKEIYLKENKKVINLAYAFYLKEYAKNIIGWDGNEETKPRDFLQKIGVELIRNQIDDRMLIRRMIEDIKVYSHFYDILTISDARFKEEIEEIKNIFPSITIHIKEKENNLTKEQKKHITETSLDNYKEYDFVISNDGTVEELKNKLEKLVNEVI